MPGAAAEVADVPARSRRGVPVTSMLLLPAGVVAALITAVRVQLALLVRWPTAEFVAVAAGLIAAGVVLSLTLAIVVRLRSPRRGLALLTVLPALLLTAGCLSVTHFPRSNFQSDEVRAEWHRLHPTMRVALWIARLGVGDLVLTDVARRPADYATMGLAPPSWSKHFLSPGDGYAHAIDLRVRDAGDLGNWARQGMFLAMGLKADRHGGTADHLHVSLPLP